MGEGECAGDWILGLPLPGMGMGAAPPIWGVLWAIAGDSLKPNWMFLCAPAGPPFATWPAGALALMVTELLRACSGPPLTMALPRATGGAATGTAGVMFGLPFIGGAFEGLPFWAEEPPTTGGWEPVAISGVDVGFLFAPAAEAYDGAAGAAGVGAGFWFG